MTISSINPNIHADILKSVGTATSSTKNNNEANAGMTTMIENHSTQHSVDRAKLVYRVNVQMRQNRNFHQRLAGRQAGRRRQIEKGKQGSDSKGSIGSNGCSAQSVTEVSMSSSMGGNSGSGGKEHPDGSLKKKQNRKKTDDRYSKNSALGILYDDLDQLAASDILVEQQSHELEKYRRWRKKIEAKLFDDMCRQGVSLREMNQYKRKTIELLGNETYITQNLKILREER